MIWLTVAVDGFPRGLAHLFQHIRSRRAEASRDCLLKETIGHDCRTLPVEPTLHELLPVSRTAKRRQFDIKVVQPSQRSPGIRPGGIALFAGQWRAADFLQY